MRSLLIILAVDGLAAPIIGPECGKVLADATDSCSVWLIVATDTGSLVDLEMSPRTKRIGATAAAASSLHPTA